MPPKPKLHKDRGKLKTLPKSTLKTQINSNSEPSISEDNQAQFEVELVWCIQQLQSALSSRKLNEKQMVEQTKTLNSLMSNSTPIIRKRQLMRLTFGDYRTKMAEEERKFMRINNKIILQSGTPSKKSVFVKKAPFLTSGKDFKFNFDLTEDISKLDIIDSPAEIPILTSNEENNIQDEHNKDFHFQPSNNVFRFNFDNNN